MMPKPNYSDFLSKFWVFSQKLRFLSKTQIFWVTGSSAAFSLWSFSIVNPPLRLDGRALCRQLWVVLLPQYILLQKEILHIFKSPSSSSKLRKSPCPLCYFCTLRKAAPPPLRIAQSCNYFAQNPGWGGGGRFRGVVSRTEPSPLLLPQPSPPIPAKAHTPAQIPHSFRAILDFLALQRLTSPYTPLLGGSCCPSLDFLALQGQLHQDPRNIRHIAGTPHTLLWYDGLNHNTFVLFIFRFLPHTKHYPTCFYMFCLTALMYSPSLHRTRCLLI